MKVRSVTRNWVLVPAAVLVLSAVVGTGAGADDPTPGSQGTDTSLPPTDSQVTVNGRGEFADLAITVNQTENLTNQAVSITWTGGQPTVTGPGRFASNYLQIMQCWGDDDGTNPDNPGPPPEQCVQGAVGGTFSGIPVGQYPNGFSITRIISRTTWENYDPELGVVDPKTNEVWRPFRAVDGTLIGPHYDPDFKPFVVGGNYWLNPYFNVVTTNEVAGSVTGADGRGAELFQVLTGLQSSGLGCGQRVQPVDGGDRKVPRCWIVVVPRSTPADENVGTPYGGERADQWGVYTSPLAPEAWQNRIAIPIEFNPVDSPCRLSSVERRVAGNELALTAVASWQPALCAGGNLPPFSYAALGDATARQQLTSDSFGGAGLVVVSRPAPQSSSPPTDPIVYAPLTASGVVIGVNVERIPRTDAPAGAQLLSGVRVADLNLTPRLVAKLLTQSYASQLTIVEPPDYEWLTNNPRHLADDPDFLRFNSEFELLQIFEGRTFSGLQLPAGNSDAASQVWEWILADPEARDWLAGEPDEWGMRVNPVYSTDPAVNPTGLPFAIPVPNSFPKAEPYCYQASERNGVVPPLLCATDWLPYTRGFSDSAQIARNAFDGARISENPFAQSPSEAWARGLPQPLGRRAMLALTDTPSASQFGLQAARLSRAGDNGADRTFIAPDEAGLIAGVAAMSPGEEPTVLEPVPDASAAGAYPLTTLTYAAIAPLSLDAAARSDYAAFIEYAAGPGQVTGREPGRLPVGYVPLPAPLQDAALTAATSVRELVPPPPEPEPTPTTTTVVPDTTSTVPATTTTNPTGAFPNPVAAPARPASTTNRTPTANASPPTTTTAPPTATSAPPDETPATEVTEPPSTSQPDIETSTTTATTPSTSSPANRLAVPALGALAIASALGALEISKRPRRAMSPEHSVLTEE